MATTTLSEICERHDLLSATASFIRRDDDTGFYACNVQWADATQQNKRKVTLGCSDDSASEALRNALAEMVALRTLDVELAA